MAHSRRSPSAMGSMLWLVVLSVVLGTHSLQVVQQQQQQHGNSSSGGGGSGSAPRGRWAESWDLANTAACNATSEPGKSRRDCADLWFNNVTSPEQCQAKCCALGPSHPAPFPNDGCIAWTQNNYAQCFLCMGSRHPGGPPASAPANCTPGKGTTNCSTGVVTPPPPPPRPPAPATGPLGAEASPEYLNYARLMRWPAYPNNTGKLNVTAGELSPDGWPNRDCVVTVFDLRPIHAWAPPLDDPEARQRNLSGMWDVTFDGAADVTLASGSGAGMRLLPDVQYNATSNTQRQTLVVSDGRFPGVENLLILNFTATRVNESAPTGSGFRNLRVVRRNASAAAAAAAASGSQSSSAAPPLFTDNWARAHRMYDHTRWMAAMDINDYGFLCGGVNAAGCSVIRWEDRQLPTFAFQDSVFCPGCRGLPWEHVLLAANELGRDVWINVPVTASAPTVCRTKENGDPRECLDADNPESTYEYQLAQLFLHGNEFTGNVGLDPGLKIYIEHSNEAWNFGFITYALNKAMADWEVVNGTTRFPAGTSNLLASVPGRPDLDAACNASAPPNSPCWQQRRHARRVYEIGKTFRQVFGEDKLTPQDASARIRMVYASWATNPQEFFNDTLAWLQSQYGPVDQYLYAIASTQYFGPEGSDGEHHSGSFNYSNATVSSAVDAFVASVDDMVVETVTFVELAKNLGVKVASYEGGPGYAVGVHPPGSKALDTMIGAARSEGMFEAVYHDVREMAWYWGWDIYNYFSAVGEYSTYGCWGATEDFADLDPGPPKLRAIYNLTGTDPADIARWAHDTERSRARDFFERRK